MGFIMIIISGILLILGITIGIQNGNTIVDFNLLKWHYSNVPLTLLLIEAVAVGIVITVIVAGINEIRLRGRLWNLQKENKKLLDELKALKNIPFAEESEESEGIAESEEVKTEEEKMKEEDEENK